MITAKELEDLALKYFNKYAITPDIDKVLPQVNGINLTIEQTENIFKVIRNNISFFEKELNINWYPLALSNLLHYTIDALYKDEKEWYHTNKSGTAIKERSAITMRYKKLITKRKKLFKIISSLFKPA
jgi:hypothetical protein